MQRRNVDLPEPDGPSRHMTSLRLHLERDALQHLEAAEALVHRLGLDHRRRSCGSRSARRPDVADQQAAAEALQRRRRLLARRCPRPKWRST